MEQQTLCVRHSLPSRVRLQWPTTCPAEALHALGHQLQDQAWLRCCHWHHRSRCLVLELEPGCSELRWQIALSALGWQLEHPQPEPCSGLASPWDRLSRQLGGSMLGSALGQVLCGGVGAITGTVLFGPTGALTLGATGAVVGSVLGSIAGTALVDGQAAELPHTLGQLGWRKLGTRMGAEAGSRTGMAMGAAVAGPMGAVAGLAVGSILGGQLVTDLTGTAAQRAAIGHRGWFVGMLRDTTAEGISESLAGGLGAQLSGGSEAARGIAASLAGGLSRRIDWQASVQSHQLLPRQSFRRPSHSTTNAIGEGAG